MTFTYDVLSMVLLLFFLFQRSNKNSDRRKEFDCYVIIGKCVVASLPIEHIPHTKTVCLFQCPRNPANCLHQCRTCLRGNVSVCVYGQSLVIRTFSQSQDLYEALTHIGSKALIWKVDCKANVRSAAFQKVPF